MTYTLLDENTGNERDFETIEGAREKRQEMLALGADSADMRILDDDGDDITEREETEPQATDGGQQASQGVDAEPDPDFDGSDDANQDIQYADDPVAYLREINDEYVNTVKGTDAISKRGFRYLQSAFGITTTSQIVHYVYDDDDFVGVIVHARAQMPDGRSADAHGEAYTFESGFDKHEVVRYADTRSKNRALSDLTSAGALAESELQ